MLAWALTALLATPAATTDQHPAEADTLDRIRSRGELRWGADVQGGEPYVFEDPKDPRRVIGFEVDIADAFARRLGVRARFSQADWSSLVPSLERHDFDVAMNGLEDTPARRDRILLSEPYFVFGETLAVKRGSPFRTFADLRHERVGTLNQSYALDLLRAGGQEPVLYEGVSEPYTDLELGRLSGVLLDHVIADRYGCPNVKLECLREDVARGSYVVGMRREDARLKAALDAAIVGARADGELRGILERWGLWDARQETQTAPVGAASGTANAETAFAHSPGPTATSSLVPATASATGSPAAAQAARGWTRAETWLFFQGAAVTVGLSVAAFALALPLGLGLALARLDRGRAARLCAAAYVEVFRGTPLLLQLYVLYYALAPVVRLSPLLAAVLGLALNYGAYEAEIHRGALQAVPRGQSEAARALGLTRWQSLRQVELPQSLRIALPSMTNDFVALLKDSSLVSVITVVELTKRMTISAVDLRGWLLPGLACAALYFAMSYPLSRLAQRLERRLRRDQNPQPA